jgi:hypothetical protein
LDDNPVWEVYDLRRTALLNVKYYQRKLAVMERKSFWMDLLIGIPASSTLAGLWLWTTDLGKIFWTVLGTVTAILAFLKPRLKLSERTRAMEKALAGYTALEHDLAKLQIEIAHAKSYGQLLQKKFLDAFDRKGVLVKQGPADFQIDENLARTCQLEVENQLPLSAFYIPPE